MDLGTTFVGIIILLIGVIPFAYFYFKRKRKSKLLLERLHALAIAHQCNISQQDTWGNHAIGMDEVNGYAFFYKTAKEQPIQWVLPLREYWHTRVILNSTTPDYKGAYQLTGKIDLALSHHGNLENEIRLEFFNTDADGLTLSTEYHLAEKWRKLLQQGISKHTTA